MKAKRNSGWFVAKAALLSIVPNISLAMAATSDDLYNNYFSNVLDGRPCFARTFEDDHLKAKPGQRVRKIEIDLSKSNSDGSPNTPDRFALGFAVMLTSGPDWYGQTASCKTNDADFECYLDGDGGIFRLSPQKDGGLMFESGEYGLSIEGNDRDIELSGKDDADDHTFHLLPSKEECQSASEFFDGGND